MIKKKKLSKYKNNNKLTEKKDTLNLAFQQNELLQFNIFEDINIYYKFTIQK